MTLKPQISKRGKHYFAEVALARGPREMAVTGAGGFDELFGYAWMAILDRGERRLRLFQARDAGSPWAIGAVAASLEWVEVPVLALPHDIKELRHLGLAFDQAARPAVAYERAGEIWVRQWDPGAGQYVMRGPWPGVDPVLINDIEAGYYVPDSDVLLFHLNADRKSLIMRAQREVFEVEHLVQAFASGALLDQAVALPYQLELLGSYESESNITGVSLRSDLYPVRVEDSLGAAMAMPPSTGTYYPVVIVHELGGESLGEATAAPPPAGTYYPMVVVQDLGSESLGKATAAPPPAGTYYPVVVVRDLGSETLGAATAAPPPAGTYAVAVVVLDLSAAPYTIDDLGAASVSAPTGGTYEAV
ncbi:hypothetical protein [Oceanithermus sp.]